MTDEKSTFDTSSPEYVYKRVSDDIAARIARGELLPATRLPGERALAQEYGVALGTARRAIRDLRERELVITLPAKGTYIRAPKGGKGDGAS